MYGYPCGQGEFAYKDNEIFQGNWINQYANIKNRSFLNDILQGKRDGYGIIYIVWLRCKIEQNRPRKISHKKCLKMIYHHVHDAEKRIKEKTLYISDLFSPENFPGPYSEEIIEDICYTGEWNEDKRNGLGKNIWGNGDEYLGYWENDMQHGWGRNTWVDGSSYIGQYIKNLKEGIGHYIWEDQTMYIGEWKDNIINGIGRYIWHDGREYIGQWENGLMNGFGIHKFRDGRKYEGGWKLGKKNGIGYTIAADGTTSKDNWLDGKIQRE